MSGLQDYDEDIPNLGQGSIQLPMSVINNLQRDVLFTQDRYTNNQIALDPALNISLIRLSHLNRLTNISRREAEIKVLETKRDYAILEMFTDEEEYDSGLWFKLNSVTRNEELGIHDSVEGWKLKQLQTKPKEVTYSEKPPEKKGFFSRFS